MTLSLMVDRNVESLCLLCRKQPHKEITAPKPSFISEFINQLTLAHALLGTEPHAHFFLDRYL